jgi:hypothetical protein
MPPNACNYSINESILNQFSTAIFDDYGTSNLAKSKKCAAAHPPLAQVAVENNLTFFNEKFKSFIFLLYQQPFYSIVAAGHSSPSRTQD